MYSVNISKWQLSVREFLYNNFMIQRKETESGWNDVSELSVKVRNPLSESVGIVTIC
jgi:hypothetical protein